MQQFTYLFKILIFNDNFLSVQKSKKKSLKITKPVINSYFDLVITGFVALKVTSRLDFKLKTTQLYI